MSEFRANITAVLNTKGIPAQIANIQKERIYLNNISVNVAAVRKSIQNQLNGGKFTMNLSNVNVAGLSEKLSASMSKNLGNQKIVLNNITLNTQGLAAKIQKALDGRKFTLNLSDVKINTNQITGQVKAATKAATTEAAKAHKEQAKAAEEAAKAERKLAEETKKAQEETLTKTKANTLSNNITAWMTKNTRAAEVFGSQLNTLQAQLANCKDSGQLRQLSAEFANIRAQAAAAGLTTNQFAKNVATLGLQVLGIGSAYQVAMKVINSVKQGISTIVDLDTALVDLRKTTTMSDTELSAFYRDANVEAKRLGVTTEEIISQAAAWSRLGYSSRSDATMMARLSSQFAAISPGVDVETATNGLVSIMKAFHVETDDVLDGIMSKVNIVGNNFAVSNADVIDGMTRMSAAMSVMNQDIDSTIALFTAANEVLQNSATTSTALRSMSLRIRGFDEETEEVSAELTNITGKIIDLTKVASKPGGVSIFTDATQTKYKDLVDYFRELSEIWDEMSDVNKNALLNDLFGKRGAQAGAALITNFASVDRALSLMESSAGDADREMSIIMDSLEYKINALKETATGIWQNLIPRDGLGDAVELLTSILSIIQAITGALGGLGSVLAVGGISGFLGGFGQSKRLA